MSTAHILAGIAATAAATTILLVVMLTGHLLRLRPGRALRTGAFAAAVLAVGVVAAYLLAADPGLSADILSNMRR